MFTTEPSINAMLDPRMVAASVRRLRLCDNVAGNTGVAWIMPASPGDRVKPTMGASERSCGLRGLLAIGQELAGVNTAGSRVVLGRATHTRPCHIPAPSGSL